MKLHQIDGISHYLIKIRSLDLGTLKLHYKNHPPSQQNAVHSKATSPEIVLQNHIFNLICIWRREKIPKDWDPFIECSLKEIDTPNPFFILRRLDIEAFRRGSSGQPICDSLRRLIDELCSTR
jgi:hypothetical protein